MTIKDLSKMQNDNTLNHYVKNNITDKYIAYIIYLRCQRRKSWQYIACVIGGNNTVDSVKKCIYRYLSRLK
ncbi:MAG: hypothetical protein RSA99_01495 [Oscillospiraceae bacterium]